MSKKIIGHIYWSRPYANEKLDLVEGPRFGPSDDYANPRDALESVKFQDSKPHLVGVRHDTATDRFYAFEARRPWNRGVPNNLYGYVAGFQPTDPDFVALGAVRGFELGRFCVKPGWQSENRIVDEQVINLSTAQGPDEVLEQVLRLLARDDRLGCEKEGYDYDKDYLWPFASEHTVLLEAAANAFAAKKTPEEVEAVRDRLLAFLGTLEVPDDSARDVCNNRGSYTEMGCDNGLNVEAGLRERAAKACEALRLKTWAAHLLDPLESKSMELPAELLAQLTPLFESLAALESAAEIASQLLGSVEAFARTAEAGPLTALKRVLQKMENDANTPKEVREALQQAEARLEEVLPVRENRARVQQTREQILAGLKGGTGGATTAAPLTPEPKVPMEQAAGDSLFVFPSGLKDTRR